MNYVNAMGLMMLTPQVSLLSLCSYAEKDRYFANFSGTNELDIKVRGDKRDPKPAQPGGAGISPSQPFHTNYTATMKLNKSATSASASSSSQNDVLQ